MNKQKSIKFIVLNVITVMLMSTFISNIFAAPSVLINSNNTSSVNNINTDNIDIVGGAYGELLNSLDQHCVKLANSVGLNKSKYIDKIKKKNFNIFCFISVDNYSNLSSTIRNQAINRNSYIETAKYIFEESSIPGIIMEQADYQRVDGKQKICRSMENISDSFEYSETLIRSTFGNKYNRALEQSKKYIDRLKIKKINQLKIQGQNTDTFVMKDPIIGYIKHIFIDYVPASKIYEEAQKKYPDAYQFPKYVLGHEKEFWDEMDKMYSAPSENENKTVTENNYEEIEDIEEIEDESELINNKKSLLEIDNIKTGGSYKDILEAKQKYIKSKEYDGKEYDCHHLISKEALKIWGNKIRETQGNKSYNDFILNDKDQNWAPSITMEHEDHRQTLSYYEKEDGFKEKNNKSAEYRKTQAQKIIEEGDIISVLNDEIKFIEDTFGHKYDRAIEEVQEYIKSLNIKCEKNKILTMKNPCNEKWFLKYNFDTTFKKTHSQNKLFDPYVSISKSLSRKIFSQNNNQEDESDLPSKKAPK